MKHPPYHLRPNKAVDRFMLIEAIRRIGSPRDIAGYTYYGFGGPYLEEFRLLHERFPSLNLVSIEENVETLKRQKFHLPCRRIKLRLEKFKSFLDKYDSRDKPSIFWLDYTDLQYSMFEEFQQLLTKVAENSIVKITLRSEPEDFNGEDKKNEFTKQYANILPQPNSWPPSTLNEFAVLLQQMTQIASQTVLQGSKMLFQPISSYCYKDGVGMFTLTGIVCLKSNVDNMRERYYDQPSSNLAWQDPKLIDVPFLSTKERLHLQKRLPRKKYAGQKLCKYLGYLIAKDEETTTAQLSQYAEYYSHYPYFVRAIP